MLNVLLFYGERDTEILPERSDAYNTATFLRMHYVGEISLRRSHCNAKKFLEEKPMLCCYKCILPEFPRFPVELAVNLLE